MKCRSQGVTANSKSNLSVQNDIDGKRGPCHNFMGKHALEKAQVMVHSHKQSVLMDNALTLLEKSAKYQG